MKIIELHLIDFGKFHQKTFKLSDQTTLFYGLNEAGKTTIHAFIEGMFYGFLSPTSKRKTWEAAYERYKPRKSKAYHGALVFEKDGKQYRLERNFLKRQDDVKLFINQTGEDITHTLDKDPVTKQADIGKFIDMPYVLYKNTLSIKQLNQATNSDASDDLFRRLQNLEATKTESFSTAKAIESLNQELNEIGTERAQTKPYAKALSKQAQLEKEYQASVNQEEEILTLKVTKDTHEQKLAGAIHQKKTLNETLLLQENTQKIKVYEQIISHYDAFEQALKDALGTIPDELLNNHTNIQATIKPHFKDLQQHKTQIITLNTTLGDLGMQMVDDFKIIKQEDYLKLQKDYHNAVSLERAINEAEVLRLKAEAQAQQAKIDAEIETIQNLTKTIEDLTKQTTLKTWLNLLIIPFFIRVFSFNKRKLKTEKTIDLKHSKSKKEALENDLKQTLKHHARIEKQNTMAKNSLDKTLDQYDVNSIEALQTHWLKTAKHYEETVKQTRLQKSYQEVKTKLKAIEEALAQALDVFKLPFNHHSLDALIAYERFSERIEALLKGESFKAFKASIDFKQPLVSLDDYETTKTALEKVKETLHQEEKALNHLTYQMTLLRDNHRPLETIKYELNQIEALINTYDQKKALLNESIERLEHAAKTIEENFAPLLSEAISSFLKPFTLNHYEEIKVKKDLTFKVLSTLNTLEEAAFFSSGTKDQIYFAMRLGILKILNKQSLPIILDGAFVNFDQERLTQALKTLIDFKKDSQLIIFTCHEREAAILDRAQIPYHKETIKSLD